MPVGSMICCGRQPNCDTIRRVGLVARVPTSERKTHGQVHVRPRPANRQSPAGKTNVPRHLGRQQARHRGLARPQHQQVHRLYGGRAPGARAGRVGSRRDRVDGNPADPCLAAAQGEGHRPRPVHPPDEFAGDKPDAVLSHPDVGPGPLPRDRVRPDDRRGLPEVRPHSPPSARDVSVDHPQGARQGSAAQLAGQGRALHLRDQRRPHPRPGRPGSQRHGHCDREATAVHGGGGRAAGGPAANVPGCRHQ